MKKFLITLAIVFGVIIIALIVIPVFFKGDIIRLIESQSSKYIKSELKIGDVSLSMFKSFPDLNVSLDDVLIFNNNADTLVNIPRFEASVNLKSLLSDKVVINHLLLKDCRINPRVSSDGSANWDILIPSDTTTSEEVTPASPETPAPETDETDISLNDIEIRNLHIDYKDYQSSTYASIQPINLKLQGNFSQSNTLLDILLSLGNIYFRQGNSVWVNNTNLEWQAKVGADLQNYQFEMQENTLAINDLKLNLAGKLGIGDDKYTMDLQLNAPDTRFETLLNLIPKEFQQKLENIKTAGEFQLNLSAKGEYYEEHLPALDIKFNILNARLQYPDLPEAVENINLKLNVTNPGGAISLTKIDLSTLTFTIARNPFSMNLLVENPEDPLLKGNAKGTINFESLKKALPLEDMTLQGILTTDLAFNGKYQYIEKEEYEKFSASGEISLKDVLFKSKDFPQGIAVPTGTVQITPARLNLKKLQVNINSSDFTLAGNLSNYLPYIFKNQTLKGDFSLTSNNINLNEFMTSTPTQAADTTTQTGTQTATPTASQASTGSVLEVPKDLQLNIKADIKKLLFDNLTINNIKGTITTREGIASLQNLDMDLLKGKFSMSGAYNTKNPEIPSVNLSINAKDFDIQSAYQAFSFVRQSIPVAMNCSGKISADMKLAANLDQEMNLVMTTANGNGELSTIGFLINDNPTLNQLSTLLKNEELSRLSISKLNIKFKVTDGDITVEPFTTMIAGNKTTIQGTQSADGKLNYVLSMNIAREYFGKDINNVLKAIPGSDNIKALDVDVKIGGTLDKPTVSPDLTKALKSIEKEATKNLKKDLLKGLNKLFK